MFSMNTGRWAWPGYSLTTHVPTLVVRGSLLAAQNGRKGQTRGQFMHLQSLQPPGGDLGRCGILNQKSR